MSVQAVMNQAGKRFLNTPSFAVVMTTGFLTHYFTHFVQLRLPAGQFMLHNLETLGLKYHVQWGTQARSMNVNEILAH